jgi:hypothetical protein
MKKYNRREFIKNASYAVYASRLPFSLDSGADVNNNPLIVRVHDSNASRPWDYGNSKPWDYSVEPLYVSDMKKSQYRSDRYFDYINDDVVYSMLRRGLNVLTGARETREAWGKILPNYKKEDKITVKINLNNASYYESITTNRLDQSVPLINAIVRDLTENFSVPGNNITIADPSRWIHPKVIRDRCRYKEVIWVDSRSGNLWDHAETVVFTKDQPVRPDKQGFPEFVNFYIANVYTKSDHIINVCLLKNHGCGITGAMKNHFGAIQPPSPKYLHAGLGEKSYIADLCNTDSIRKKVRINICDAIFANWHDNVWSPRPWKTFSEESPNSLFFGRDPVAFDSVLLQHITDEVHAQRENAPAWVREAVGNHGFLQYAMDYHKLGIHEHKPFLKIQYRSIEMRG